MNTTIARWGDSLAIRIPAAEAAKAVLREGDVVALSALDQGKLLIETVPSDIDVASLYDRITPENRHDEVSWGSPVGAETSAW